MSRHPSNHARHSVPVRTSGTVAFDDPRVRDALHQYRARTARACGLGVGGLVLATAIVGISPNDGPSGIAAGVSLGGLAAGAVALGFGVGGFLRSLRMSWHLKRASWTERKASYRIAPMGANGQPALLIKGDAQHEEAVCSVPATVWRYRKLPQGPDVRLLVVGNPRRWCVVAPPDLTILLCAKRPWVPFWGRALRRYATTW
jgi:hypothetical protein